jgi:hypothetical protein
VSCILSIWPSQCILWHTMSNYMSYITIYCYNVRVHVCILHLLYKVGNIQMVFRYRVKSRPIETNSTEYSQSWDATSHSATYKTPHLEWNPKVSNIHNSLAQKLPSATWNKSSICHPTCLRSTLIL